MTFDRQYLICGLIYALAGMGLGIVMAKTANVAQHVTHAHILLVGFAVSLIYAIIHKLWLANANHRLALVQFYAHQTGSLVMFAGLFLFYGGHVPEPQVGPVLGLASFAVLTGAVLMLVMVLMSGRQPHPHNAIHEIR
ncbi:hypothetical protein SAMN05216203_1836 [Marinobacter daqiaonensis]|uniref:Uncharacterized protein n=1 Tax=Marinobacter daqiaonensis TaxID=650891 RepID=A0A1I6I5G4_9GAMM|nr:TonB-dependent receptor [Marinobacter daqiaonensis]SFR61878.1 hypothetical protein SAMN05216203_1836 [Marinobacter daqiaonensis]